MANEKYTLKQFYAEVIEGMADNANAVEVAKKKLAQLEAKNAGSSAKRDEEQEAFFEIIRDILSDSPTPMQCGAIAKDSRAAEFEWKDGKETSAQRVSAMLKKMVDKGDVEKFMEKKVTYFKLV